ncbi:hypothetical protein HRbin22_01529 [Candidatus Thermoflexus japonica]|uniref:Uncharacterized protein n=2 Tax=root TaxID=1 RepID=A0A2H5Y776_9CHLR|nr:hypothetical protein HGMM_F03G07C06 [uncultured prokaryote]GBD09279.1 hypothetical protein HRbin22_01529 [Candidatus Thermoflexus japonica]
MLRTRCPYCSRPFSISREEAGAILAQALAANARYGVRECPFCRRIVKIGLAELRRAAPVLSEAPARAETETEALGAPAVSLEPAPASEEKAAGELAAPEPPVPSIAEPSSLEQSTEPPPRRRGKRAKEEEATPSAPRRTRARPAATSSEEEKSERPRRSRKKNE